MKGVLSSIIITIFASCSERDAQSQNNCSHKQHRTIIIYNQDTLSALSFGTISASTEPVKGNTSIRTTDDTIWIFTTSPYGIRVLDDEKRIDHINIKSLNGDLNINKK